MMRTRNFAAALLALQLALPSGAGALLPALAASRRPAPAASLNEPEARVEFLSRLGRAAYLGGARCGRVLSGPFLFPQAVVAWCLSRRA